MNFAGPDVRIKPKRPPNKGGDSQYDILLTDAMVIPVEPEHHIWEKGYIAITGDRIAALGPMEELGGELPQARQHISL